MPSLYKNNVIQRRRRRLLLIQRASYVSYQRSGLTLNNIDTIRAIQQLPQQITQDEFTNQFFNGFSY
jgi:hypothetical protein